MGEGERWTRSLPSDASMEGRAPALVLSLSHRMGEGRGEGF